jgi:hypothetical protein
VNEVVKEPRFPLLVNQKLLTTITPLNVIVPCGNSIAYRLNEFPVTVTCVPALPEDGDSVMVGLYTVIVRAFSGGFRKTLPGGRRGDTVRVTT